MKKVIKNLSPAKICLIIATIALVTCGSSCKKSTETNSANFTGTYVGTLVASFVTEGDTVVITQGSTSGSVIMNSKTARGSTYTINGTVNGNSLNIPSQQVYVASLGSTYTTIGSGSLSGNTLTISYSFSGNGLTFTGTKQ